MDIEKKIISWMRIQVKKAKAKGIVMGLSGGVDSSVVAVLAKKAAGKNLLCLILPCHSLKQDLEDARLMARKFKLRTRLIDLSKIYDSLISIFPSSDVKTRGNLKSRLRMITFYFFANKLNYLVAGTGNKSELYAGYFTKYGDAGVDILPIGNLFKSQVWNLARTLGLPQRIINKPPSAGLWQGQTDEGELGITYNELDKTLSYLLSGRKQKITIKNLKKVKNLIALTEHKRKPAAICYLKKVI